MFVLTRFYFPLYAKVDDVLGQIEKLRKADPCFGSHVIFWVRKLFLLSGIGCKNVCGIIYDANSLTMVEEETKLVVSLKLVLLEVRDLSQPHLYSRVEFLEYSGNLVDQVAGGCCR